ncbi:MAG: hypothetical protein MI673_06880, partial [Thiotrichales bacterium]|nr:hypothetical protein [Thiotrichales bacterium]
AIKLKDEYELFNGKMIDWQQWKDQAIDRLLVFIEDEMEMTEEEFDTDGNSRFQQAVLANVNRLRAEPPPGQN